MSDKYLGPYTINESAAYANVVMKDLLSHDEFWDMVGIKNPGKNLKVLGSGANGVAFGVGKGKVIKITEDDEEASTSAYLVGKTIKGVNKIHAVYQWKKHKHWYIILQDEVKIDRARAAKAYNSLDNIFTQAKHDELIKWYHRPAYTEDWKEVADKIIPLITNKDAEYLAHTMLRLVKNKIEFGDLHTGNIGFVNGKPVIIDLGVSESPKGKINTFEGIE